MYQRANLGSRSGPIALSPNFHIFINTVTGNVKLHLNMCQTAAELQEKILWLHHKYEFGVGQVMELQCLC